MSRIGFFLAIFNRRIPKVLLALWAIAGAYDLSVSQFLADELAKDAPTVWKMVAASASYLPSWSLATWLLVFAGLIVVIFFEYLFRFGVAQRNGSIKRQGATDIPAALPRSPMEGQQTARLKPSLQESQDEWLTPRDALGARPPIYSRAVPPRDTEPEKRKYL